MLTLIVVENPPVSGATDNGILTISGGPAAIEGWDITSGETIQVLNGGYAGNITLNGGAEDLAAGYVLSITSLGEIGGAGGFGAPEDRGATIMSFGHQDLLSGAIAISDIVQSTGGQFVQGGTASGSIVSSGGLQTLQGGTADNTILVGGTQLVYSGGTAVGTTIENGGLLASPGGALSGSVKFAGSGGTLQITGRVMPIAVISGFVAGDTIDLSGVPFVGGGVATLKSGNILQVAMNGDTYDLPLNPSQNLSGASFQLSSDRNGGTDVEEGGYELLFNFSQSVGANNLIQEGTVTSYVYYDGQIIYSLSYQASGDDAFPLLNTAGYAVDLGLKPSLISPAGFPPNGLGLEFNINLKSVLVGENQNSVNLHLGTVPYNSNFSGVKQQYSWDSQSCLVVSQIYFLTFLEKELYFLDTGTLLTTSTLSSGQAMALSDWINGHVDVQILSADTVPQPKLTVQESTDSVSQSANGTFSQGTFQFNISRPIEKLVKVLYKVTDQSKSITGTAYIQADSYNSQPIWFSSLFSSSLPYKAGDSYIITITGYEVQYHAGMDPKHSGAAAWYEDGGSLANEKLMFGAVETVGFGIPLDISKGQTKTAFVDASGHIVDVLAGGLVRDSRVLQEPFPLPPRARCSRQGRVVQCVLFRRSCRCRKIRATIPRGEIQPAPTR